MNRMVGWSLLAVAGVGGFYAVRAGLATSVWPRLTRSPAAPQAKVEPQMVPRHYEPDFRNDADKGILHAQVVTLLMDVQSAPEPPVIEIRPLEANRHFGEAKFYARLPHDASAELDGKRFFPPSPVEKNGLAPGKEYSFVASATYDYVRQRRSATSKVVIPGGKNVTVTFDFRYLAHHEDLSLVSLDRLVPKHVEVEQKAMKTLSPPAARRVQTYLDAHPARITPSTTPQELRHVLFERMRKVRDELRIAFPDSKYLK